MGILKESHDSYLSLIMKFKLFTLSCLISLNSLCTTAFAQINDISNLRKINEGDWRSTSPNIPWSTPVIVKDEFSGDYLAVFDHNFHNNFWTGEKNDVISNWSRNYLRIYHYNSYCRDKYCIRRQDTIREATDVAIKIDTKVFNITGKSGNFQLPEEVAYALKNSPQQRTKIKIIFEGSGAPVVSDIGEGTVKSWKTVYQDVKNPSEAIKPSDVKPPEVVKSSEVANPPEVVKK